MAALNSNGFFLLKNNSFPTQKPSNFVSNLETPPKNIQDQVMEAED